MPWAKRACGVCEGRNLSFLYIFGSVNLCMNILSQMEKTDVVF